MKIVVIDNYDSFTYNLVHAIKKLSGEQVTVFRNDELELKDLERFDKIVLSPGPGIPEEAGLLLDIIRTYAPTKSIFGVCLGMQAIGEVFGGQLVNMNQVLHGVATPVKHFQNDSVLFRNIPEEFEAGRYHSWIVGRDNLPKELEITAVDKTDRIMGLKHVNYDVRGVQFHPESVLTPLGEKIIENWINN